MNLDKLEVLELRYDVGYLLSPVRIVLQITNGSERFGEVVEEKGFRADPFQDFRR